MPLHKICCAFINPLVCAHVCMCVCVRAQMWAGGSRTVFFTSQSTGALIPTHVHMQQVEDTILCAIQPVQSTRFMITYMRASGKVVGMCKDSLAYLNVSCVCVCVCKNMCVYVCSHSQVWVSYACAGVYVRTRFQVCVVRELVLVCVCVCVYQATMLHSAVFVWALMFTVLVQCVRVCMDIYVCECVCVSLFLSRQVDPALIRTGRKLIFDLASPPQFASGLEDSERRRLKASDGDTCTHSVKVTATRWWQRCVCARVQALLFAVCR